MPEHGAECKCWGDRHGGFGVECMRVQVPSPPIAKLQAKLLYWLKAFGIQPLRLTPVAEKLCDRLLKLPVSSWQQY